MHVSALQRNSQALGSHSCVALSSRECNHFTTGKLLRFEKTGIIFTAQTLLKLPAEHVGWRYSGKAPV